MVPVQHAVVLVDLVQWVATAVVRRPVVLVVIVGFAPQVDFHPLEVVVV